MRNRGKIGSFLELADRHRIWLLLIAVWAVMSCIAPNFATLANTGSILKASATHLPAAIGLTLVIIAGQLDLSFGSGMSLAGMVTIGFQPRLGWFGAIGAALLVGLLVGALNGLLVTRAKVNSFIATLGTLTILQGVVNIASKGGTLAVQEFAAGDWLENTVFGVFSPRVMIVLGMVLLSEVALHRTLWGRNLLLVGSNPVTAWYAGFSTRGYIAAAFMLSGILSAAGGSLFAVSVSSANPLMGENSLMIVIAAVIIGGASMRGGRGSVLQTAAAVLALVSLSSGLSCMGARPEAQLLASGFVLGASVVYDAILARNADRRKGMRLELL